jgi:hypothetical protein
MIYIRGLDLDESIGIAHYLSTYYYISIGRYDRLGRSRHSQP